MHMDAKGDSEPGKRALVRKGKSETKGGLDKEQRWGRGRAIMGPGYPVWIPGWHRFIYLFIYLFATPHSLQDLKSLTRIQTQFPGSGGRES